jgi:hypothetical protein
MVQESDTVSLSRRRQVLVVRCLCCILSMLAGIEISARAGPSLLGYFVAIVGALSALYFVVFMVMPPEELLQMPVSFFWLIAPNDPGNPICSSEIPGTAKSPTAIPESLCLNSGVWDRELDGDR